MRLYIYSITDVRQLDALFAELDEYGYDYYVDVTEDTIGAQLFIEATETESSQLDALITRHA